jgi:hypothetical protein
MTRHVTQDKAHQHTVIKKTEMSLIATPPNQEHLAMHAMTTESLIHHLSYII